MKLDSPAPLAASRRRFLRNFSIAATGLALLGVVQACSSEEPEMKACSMADLEKKKVLSISFNEKPVMLVMNEKKITAFSLVCTHKKCTVKWLDDKQQFKCPCHKGTYDATGKVISGPPPRPLDRFKTEIRGEEVWLLNQPES